MLAKLNIGILIFITIIGMLLTINAILHFLVYLVEGQSMISGLRFWHWVSLMVGAFITYKGLLRLSRR
ncbi:MAG: hypothetical protein AAF985_23260 [Bacteroidota bacterium]